MANNTLSASIDLVGLDFAALKTSFINYLKAQTQFRDYDFDGSNLNVLLDILSLNTFKNAFFLNMAISEGFLDSAQVHTSVLSHAKELNYLPRSVRSSAANVTISFTATGESQPYTIQKGSQLTTMIKSRAFTFSIPETIICSSANTSFTFTTDIYEGVYKKDAYLFLDNVENQRFTITNKNVDTRSISVTVYEDGDQLGDTYTRTSTLLDLTETSKVFFLQTSQTGFYEIYFGDDNLGREPKVGSTIVIDYRVSQGLKGNGARDFSVDFDPTSPRDELTSTPTLVINTVASDGAEAETDESIRYYAPRHFQVQERAITALDYEVALKNEFPEINAVSVYGGDEVEPPQMGRVFVAVDISDVDGLPESKKDEYYDFIKRRSAFSIQPIFIEPAYLYLAITSLIRYNLNITSNSINRIKTLVTDAITEFNEDNLDDFNVTLRYSQLMDTIGEADRSIISNITEANVYKKVLPVLNEAQNIDIEFNIPLLDNLPLQKDSHLPTDMSIVWSSSFSYGGVTCTIEDDNDGTLRIVKKDGESTVVVVDCGTVDYATGHVQLVNFTIGSHDGEALKVYARPLDKDVAADKNTILTVETSEINLTVDALRE